jgi:ABC-type transport system substrate-binding protein
MVRRIMTRLGVAVSVAAVVLSLSAGAALAGEITGTGKSLEPLHANSICAYSGLNDDPEGLDPNNGPPGRTQSYGQDVRMGFIDPRAFNPGDACRGGSL